ncbi:CRISPR-associated protein, Csd1 family [Candidatus Moduliflexus flocculans]|uniref:CRISPR-associated protein, Csd1 family n=1 Tax=Candidatus Moduliflexus flocculans TaxID=1499966 RepID=A0A0S6W415_9BACT|nr:CRISPR-associated protein, Csd1 family [Candidatus Moduliflexus flocculans]
MILQELTTLYQRLQNNPDLDICEPGFSKENISFKIVIDRDGNFKSLEDLRTTEGKNVRPVKILVPKFDGKRTVGIKSYFLWDKSDYTIGWKKDEKAKEFSAVEMPKTHGAFIELLDEIAAETGLHHPAVAAIKNFSTNPATVEKLRANPKWEEFLNTFAVFEVEGFGKTVFDDPAITDAWRRYYAVSATGKEMEQGLCLVSGNLAALTTTLPTIKKGVGGKNDTPFVSCNIESGESYRLTKGQNAPISSTAAAQFTGALNYLIDTPKHNLKIGDTVTIFWAERNDKFSDAFGEMFDMKRVADDAHSKDLHIFLQRIRSGKLPDNLEHDDSRFFVLGLAPNAARVSVRFWHVDTVEQMAGKIGRHFEQLQLVRQFPDKEQEFPSMWQLLVETAALHETKNIPPNIVGPLMRSILSGHDYPKNLLSILVSRMRVDQGYNRLSYYRASFIKAILNRNYHKELAMSLDKDRTSVPYCLGRLFAVLEKNQEDSAEGNINATIRDRYFATASAKPKVVFALILRLAQNHLKKLKSVRPKSVGYRERLLGEIMGKLTDFPATLALEDQGEFAIGYYHQRQSFFTGKGNATVETSENQPETIELSEEE